MSKNDMEIKELNQNNDLEPQNDDKKTKKSKFDIKSLFNKGMSFKEFVTTDYTRKFLSVVISVICGLLFGLLIMLFVNPAQAFGGLGAILSAGFLQGGRSIGRVLFNAAPLILTGLAVAFAFKTGLFNIGASGQLMIGAFIAVYIGVKWNLPPTIHWMVAERKSVV